MAVASKLLDDIITHHNQIANLQTVCLDIEAYSRRRTSRQVDVIAKFTECLAASRRLISQKYVEYAQKNNVNFSTDIVVLPTGDGALVSFAFSGLHDIHIEFARAILEQAFNQRKEDPCDRFNTDGWCNCHSHFNLRIGISEGKGVVYKDVNDGYNVAGGPINLSARVMGMVERNQIAFTELAYQQYVDLAEDPNIADHFRLYPDVRIKHDLRIPIYQYMDDSAPGLNSEECESLVLMAETQEIYKRIIKSGFPALPGLSDSEMGFSRAQALEAMKAMEAAITAMFAAATGQAGVAAAVPMTLPGVVDATADMDGNQTMPSAP